MSTNQRIRGRQLKAIRKRLFEDQPLCVECERQGRIRAATERDHIIPISQGGEDTEANTQALCHACNAAKGIAETGRKPKQRIGLDGWPIDANS